MSRCDALTFYTGFSAALREGDVTTVEYRATKDGRLYHLWFDPLPPMIVDDFLIRDNHAIPTSRRIFRGPLPSSWFSGIGMLQNMGQPLQTPGGGGVQVHESDIVRLVLRSCGPWSEASGVIVTDCDFLKLLPEEKAE